MLISQVQVQFWFAGGNAQAIMLYFGPCLTYLFITLQSTETEAEALDSHFLGPRPLSTAKQTP